MGSKQIMGLGMLAKDCHECDGAGFVSYQMHAHVTDAVTQTTSEINIDVLNLDPEISQKASKKRPQLLVPV
jgi:hypothetical protein